MLRKLNLAKRFSSGNIPLSLTPKFFLLSYDLEHMEDKEEIRLTE